MCSVSMVGDHYRDMWQPRPWYPNALPAVPMPGTLPLNQHMYVNNPPQISRSEFDDLKRQVAEMKELLKRAKAYDEANGEPECEMDEKMEILRKVAKIVGVSLDDVIGKGAAK